MNSKDKQQFENQLMIYDKTLEELDLIFYKEINNPNTPTKDKKRLLKTLKEWKDIMNCY